MEIHRQRAVRRVGHDAIGADKASECRIVVASIIEQQARAVILALVGVVELGAAHAAVPHRAPRVERLSLHCC